MKLSELETQLAGKYWGDHLSLDERIIESGFCPHCHYLFAYKGVSNANEYRAYGVCEPCDYAELFWRETAALAAAKKSFMPAAA